MKVTVKDKSEDHRKPKPIKAGRLYKYVYDSESFVIGLAVTGDDGLTLVPLQKEHTDDTLFACDWVITKDTLAYAPGTISRHAWEEFHGTITLESDPA